MEALDRNLEVSPNLKAMPACLRVLAVIPGDGRGVCLIAARRQVRSLKDRGIAIDTFFFDTHRSFAAFFRGCRELRHAVRARCPDIVHVHYGTITALACSLVVNKPLIATFRGSDLQPEPGIGWLRTRLSIVCSQLAALRCTKMIAVSRALASRLWWRKQRIVVLPTGVDLRRFAPVNRQEARRRLDWHPNETVLLFNAGLAPQVKDLDLAQDAARRVSRALSIRFEVMHGDVPPERVPLYMSAADCLLVTSRSEGSPDVVKEALACALPVVSVDVGDVRERLEGIRPSRIVSRNPDEIAEAVLAILRNPTRSNGPDVAASFSEEHITGRLIELYQEALATKLTSPIGARIFTE